PFHRVGEGAEVPGGGQVDVHRITQVGIPVCAGGPVDVVLLGLLVPESLGGPEHPGLGDRSGDVREARLAPVHQVCRLPHHHLGRACGGGLGGAPSAAVVDAQVGGDQVELVPFGGADQERVTHSAVAFIRCQGEHGVAIGPGVGEGPGVMAGGEVDLLVGVAGFQPGEVREEVVGGLGHVVGLAHRDLDIAGAGGAGGGGAGGQ